MGLILSWSNSSLFFVPGTVLVSEEKMDDKPGGGRQSCTQIQMFYHTYVLVSYTYIFTFQPYFRSTKYGRENWGQEVFNLYQGHVIIYVV
jgi:hypothetical protein